ncbi:MAG: energy transducer TonB [Candidatus Aminicenantes bacterium]|nr:energy transducer TonB [Candidatus Aminicenantes bacterium]
MFKDTFFIPEKNIKAKMLVFPLSFLLHLGIILLLVVYPYLSTESLPEITYFKALIAPPLPVPPPHGSSASRKPRSHGARIRPVSKGAVFKGELVAPVEIPDSVAEEDLFLSETPFGIEGGDPNADPAGLPAGFIEGLITDIVVNDEEPVRAGGTVKPPKLVKRVLPLYPEIARIVRAEGIVILEATTDIFGRVVRVHVVKSIPLLDEAAADAVRKWIYEPLVLNGKPRPVVFTVTVTFELRD